MSETSDSRPNPYVGPRAFTRGETLYGRDRELTRLMHLLIAERIVVLHSPSGAGKTSLLQAGLVPRLLQEDFHVLPMLRVALELPTFDGADGTAPVNRYVLSVLLSLEEGRPDDERIPLAELARLDLPTYLERRTRAEAGEPGDWVLIFDQFEEVLTIEPNDTAAKVAFFEQVGAALRQKRYWAVFALREDYLGGLDPYLRPIPTRLHARFRLDLLSAEAAREAIQRPARTAGVDFTLGAVNRLLEDLCRVRVQQPDGSSAEQRGPYVEPVQLQVVCLRLWDRLPAAATSIADTDVEAVGDVDQALAGYYAEQVHQIAEHLRTPERTIREWVNDHLITTQDIRSQVLQGADRSEGLVNAAIWALVDAHLVRAEKRRGFTWFELAHDRLIRPIRADNAAWFVANLSELQRQAALWEQQDRPNGLLLRGHAFDNAVQWAAAQADELTPIERDFLDASRDAHVIAVRDRRRVRWIQRLGVGAAVLALVSTATSVVAFQLKQTADYNWGRAVQKTQEAVDNLDLANQKTQEAVDNLDLANQKTQEADQQRQLATQAAETATLQRVMSESRSLYHSRLDLALLLSLAAMDRSNTPESRGGLLDALNSEPRLNRFLVGHAGRVLGLAFDGNDTLISAGADNTLRTWDAHNGQQTGTITSQLGDPQLVAFSPNGTYVATFSAGQIHLWNVQSKAQVADWPPGQGVRVDALAFSPDGSLLGASGPSPCPEQCTNGVSHGQVHLWSVPDHQLLQTRDGPAPDPNGPFRPTRWSSLAFGKTNQADVVSFGANNGDIVYLNLSDPTVPGSVFHGITVTVNTLAFGPGGQYLIAGTGSSVVYRYDLTKSTATNTQPSRLWGHRLAVASIAFDPVKPQNRTLFASASADGTIIIWDTAPAEQYDPPARMGSASEVNSLVFSPDGKQLAAAGLDGPIRLWNVPDVEPELSYNAAPLGTRLENPTNGTGMIKLAFDASGRRLAGVFTDSSVGVWNTATDPPTVNKALINPTLPKATPPQRGERVFDLAFSPDSQLLATAGCDTPPSTAACKQGVVRFWDPATNAPAGQPLSVNGSGLESIAFSPDPTSHLLVAGDANGRLHAWNLADGAAAAVPQPPEGGTKPIVGLRFSPLPQDALLVSAATDGLLLWHTADLSSTPDRLSDNVGSPAGLAFSPNGTLLASVSSDDTQIQIWDMANGHATPRGKPFPVSPAAVHGLVFVDNTTLASASGDGLVRLWEVTGDTSAPVGQPLRGYPFNVSTLAFSPILGRLASSSDSNISGSGDTQKNLILWQVQPDSWRTVACRIAGHNLRQEDWAQLMGDLPYNGALCPGQPVTGEARG